MKTRYLKFKFSPSLVRINILYSVVQNCSRMCAYIYTYTCRSVRLYNYTRSRYGTLAHGVSRIIVLSGRSVQVTFQDDNVCFDIGATMSDGLGEVCSCGNTMRRSAWTERTKVNILRDNRNEHISSSTRIAFRVITIFGSVG